MSSDYPRIQGVHLLDGVGVAGWIHSFSMEQAPSNVLMEVSPFHPRGQGFSRSQEGILSPACGPDCLQTVEGGGQPFQTGRIYGEKLFL